MTPEQLAEIQRLRDRKVAPKQIARKLGLRPAEVKSAIQQHATSQVQALMDKDGLPPLEGCWANGAMVTAFLGDKKQKKGSETSGLGSVMVVCKLRNKRKVALFLVDYYCLGVKNAESTNVSSDDRFREMKEMAFAAFEDGKQEISLEQAQAVVFGAEDYARQLGFEPHRDYAKAKEILGERPEALLELEFGRDGQPFYCDGPYDNSQKVIKALEKSVGAGSFHYLVNAGMMSSGDDNFILDEGGSNLLKPF